LVCSRTSKSSRRRRRSWSAKKWKFCATRGITLLRIERSVEPLSRVSTAASSGTRASIRSPIACSSRARSSGGVRPQVSNADRAAATAAPASRASALATCAMTSSSIGETSAKASEEPTRCPPIQWSGETSTPSTESGTPDLPPRSRTTADRCRTAVVR
jgi:hypothetical protein